MQVPCRVQRCPSCNTYGKPLIGKGLPCSILVGTGTKMQHGPIRSSTGLHTSTDGTDIAAATYRYNASLARFLRLTEMAVARRSKIRAAHRRYLRRIGMPLAPLPKGSKYRAKGRKP